MGSNFARLVNESCRLSYRVPKTSNEKLEHDLAPIDNVYHKNTKSPATQDEHRLEVPGKLGGRDDFFTTGKAFQREDNGDDIPNDGKILEEIFQLPKPASTPKSDIKIDFIGDVANDNESIYITTERHEAETLKLDFDKSDDNGDGQPMPLTWIGKDTPSPSGERVDSKENNTHGRSAAQDNALISGLTPNHRGLSEQTALDGHDTDTETHNDVTDLDKVNFKPNLNIGDTLGRVGPELQHAPLYRCKTRAESINSIYLHVRSQETIYRWEPESVITFNINCCSFPNSVYARRAAACLESAAENWNKGNIGVRFERVPDDTPAVFQLAYSSFHRRDSHCLADSFFPGDSWHQQHLCVYGPAFNKVKGNYDWLTNIFCHELGHILGLRHEFAGTKELDEPSIQSGEDNDSSIMNYFEDLGEMRIQESDYSEVKRFYKSQGEYGRFRIVDVVPRCFTPLSRPLQFQLQRSTFNLGCPSRQSW
ncbi:hypothetical protein F5Y06DRAFT_51402 [Hypoxylon sp. FL0890]|nr:hypothetical protein F5Y06DRAFT_51402 [Hypoxylon sp. FL0890]